MASRSSGWAGVIAWARSLSAWSASRAVAAISHPRARKAREKAAPT